VDSKKIFITDKKDAVPQEPPSFCMFLRKHLMGATVLDVKQHGFDRIVEIYTTGGKLVFEMFPPGNAILVGEDGNIVMPLEIQKWKDRTIKPKVPYKYPPIFADTFNLDTGQLTRLLQNSDKGLAAFLAAKLGFGGMYAEEICKAVKLEPSFPAKDLDLEKTAKLHSTIHTISTMRLSPRVYSDTVSPFGLEAYKGEKPDRTEYFSEALDIFFSAQKLELKDEEIRKVEEKEEQRIEKIVEQQEQAKDKWEKIRVESKEAADLIYNNYTIVQEVLDGIKKAREQGMSWSEINERIQAEDTPIKEIKEGDARVVIELDGKEIELDFRKTVEENAANYFEDVKWARKKLVGVEKAKDIVEEKAKLEPEIKEPPKPKPKKKRGKWFHKYKHFVSSDEFLIVAGRNAKQNDMLLTKYAEDNDWVFHADIPGAAFVIIRSEGKEVPESTVKEGSEFSAANSKAWSRGLGEVDVFGVKRRQVSKPGGLAKGAWVVSGERVWFRKMALKIAVGVKVEEEGAKVVYGPVMPTKKNTNYFVTVEPGGRISSELARTIKNKILIKANPEHKSRIESVSIEDIEKAIPSGTGDVVEFG
jgi:predicted ribosome quality control (RQC) complex YloA/Tae2 family protein